MKQLPFCLIILLFVCRFSVGYAQTDSFIEVSKIESSEHLAPNGFIIPDPDHSYTLTKFLSDDSIMSNGFVPSNSTPYLDFTRSTFWMQLNAQNSSETIQNFYVELARPLTNVVNLYVLDESDKIVEIFETGDDFTFCTRPYQDRKFIFPVTFPPNSKRKLIVQARSDGEILKLPIKFWRIDSFTQFSIQENFFLGLYYGLFLLVFILFTFFGIALKERIYFYFVSYVFLLGLFQFSLDGFAFQYLWPGLPWLGNHAILIFAALSLISMLFYVRDYLGEFKHHKRYFNGYNVFILLTATCLLLSLTSGAVYAAIFPILNGLSFIVVIYFLFGLYYKSKEGNKPEIAVAIAFVSLSIGAIVFITSNVNVINSEFLATNALKISSAIELTFLSLAMAGRYRKTQDEKVAAQEEAFKALEEVNELKNKQTEELETQVKERTQEIREKNDVLSAQNEEILHSIVYAKRLQNATLPSEKVMIQLFKDSSVLYRPKDIVSGDFYWIEEVDDLVFFAVADCTGHGVPGAMLSVFGNNALNRCINEYKLKEPGKILDTLTELVELSLTKNNSEVSDGMDISLCVWDKGKKLSYAGANNPIYLIRNGELIETKADKQPIGKYITRKLYTTHEFELQEGDSVYLFSDGYADQFGGPKGKKLKYSAFKNYLMELNDMPSAEIGTELGRRFDIWKEGVEQIDDVCLMNVKF
jgi:serine phosphatase RsbU (regulator of sigma subunit)/heme/copper-type cytochrome/quinol oxidase subunit 4